MVASVISKNGCPVLIIAPPGDAHALVVAARIEDLECDVIIWDTARLPGTDHLSLQLDNSGTCKVLLRSTAFGTLDLLSVRSIWWRRPRAPTIPPSVENSYMRWYCRSEAEQLLRGALSGLQVPIYNDPDAEDRAARKPFHLRAAAEIGFTIPETLITCSPSDASSFIHAACGQNLIVKPFRSPPDSGFSTQDYESSLSEKLALLQNAPAIFQDRIGPYRDVRVAVVGDRIFAGVSESEMIDWRVDRNIRWMKHQLPAETESLILSFMRKIGLTLGHLDFRLTGRGDYVFFEVNPSGQFLFLEVDDHQIGVTAALADLLIGGSN